ncbi:MAG: ferritin-like domain-containing protein [Acidithiobacillus sp.]
MDQDCKKLTERYFPEAMAALQARIPDEKVACVRALCWPLQYVDTHLPCPTIPGRPARPALVDPKNLPRRRALSTVAGRFALLHALAHIEFNAINLALDALCRFPDMPTEYYQDWLRVAQEEAEHFMLLREQLQRLSGDYGDLPAHDGLWEMAMETAQDPLERMALVPRVLEARGLDVTPAIRERLLAAGDREAAAVLERIEREERDHVAIGSRWFRYLCAQRGLEPDATFQSLLERCYRGRIQGPLALAARRDAGFSEGELDWLQGRAVAGLTPRAGLVSHD